MKFDVHGRPRKRASHDANWSRLVDRDIDELIGFCRGTIADGLLNQTEAEALLAWIQRNPHLATTFPANVLFARLADALDDGLLDDEESRDVFELIAECVGATGDESMDPYTTTLPFCDPPPELIFPNTNYVLTGRFAWGPREDVANIIRFLGGNVKEAVSRKVSFVVCGHFATEDWIHSSHGRKIEYALELKDQGHGIYIVSERHWADFVNKTI